MSITTALVAEAIGAKNFIDENWIAWKLIDGIWVGKRCVSSKGGFRYTWLEDVPEDQQIHKFLCGEDANYNEVFNL